MKNNIYDEYLPLVIDIVNKYQHLGVPREDLIQEGLIGLMEAEKRYDASHNTKFSSYAVFWIKKYILAAVDIERKESLKYAKLAKEKAKAQAKTAATKTSQYLNLPKDMPKEERLVLRALYEEQKTLKEIADLMNISREKVRQLKEKALRRLRAKNE
ncbi:MAG: sigma-70 family RNA polymerase sigma factor [Candidatus Cloacimonetes bacterium]|nr:sigma-70 family RNA polymerase sigma factor [Candidatus Cloacimonadota bacterium]